ncbi:MAG: class I SAM-dependent methyltransferase [Legionellaceae bacterium]|nr:class I SAM-dependent methyltransferase [Legionellaceae bacterium]
MDILIALTNEINCIYTKNSITTKYFEKKALKFLLEEIVKINSVNEDEITIKNTRVYILFEGFYKFVDNYTLKKNLISARENLWKNHFGVPTVQFLLSHKKEILSTQKTFNIFTNKQPDLVNKPWMINKQEKFHIDQTNNVFIDPESIPKIVAPSEKEKTGEFTKTHNPFGGFTTSPCDPVSMKFIAHASHIAKNNGSVLEIGAAFGAATLGAIEKGVKVFCNDIAPENLAVVKNRLMKLNGNTKDINSHKDDNLVLIPGKFPDELHSLPKKSFDAILVCRVLHFFSGEKIDESLAFLTKLLTPKGKLYIVCETPFLKNWQKFIPELNSRIQAGEEWPGEINNPANFESSGRVKSLPKFVNWMTKEVLERAVKRAGLMVEEVKYINRKGQFPDDMLLEQGGRESVGAIGVCQ